MLLWQALSRSFLDPMAERGYVSRGTRTGNPGSCSLLFDLGQVLLLPEPQEFSISKAGITNLPCTTALRLGDCGCRTLRLHTEQAKNEGTCD